MAGLVTAVAAAALVVLAAADGCPHCLTVSDRRLADRLKLQAIKHQILSKLNLAQRPNLTATLPRDLALEALRRTSPRLPGHDSGHAADEDSDEYYGRTSEILAFAEPGARLNDHVLLDFFHPREYTNRLDVVSATLWVQLRYTPKLSRRLRHMLRDHAVTLYVFQATGGVDPPHLELLGSQRVPTAHGGWRRLELGPAVRRWFTTREKLTLLVDCVGCDSLVELSLFSNDNDTSTALRPFLSIPTETTRGRRTRRHALTCDTFTTQCCKQPLYVSFRELGWDDWIIAPKGYYANYCMGDCAALRRTPDTFVNFHTHVLEEYRNRNPYASITPCCAPTKLSSMSLIYFDPDLNIIKTDLPKMIVDECGCT